MDQPNDPEPTQPLPRRRMWPVFLIPGLALVALALVWRIVNEPRGQEGSPIRVPVAVETPKLMDGAQPLSVDEGDRHLRERAVKWSADPLYARWLDGVSLRHLVAAAQLMSMGESVRPALPFISVPGPFVVREEKVQPGEERLFIAPATYARYDVLARVVGSVDAAAAGEAYDALKPFVDSAFAEIGRPSTVFDTVLASAVRRVVEVKLIEGEVELVPKGAVYAFKDPELEKLSAGEKQVLRMGPKNGAVLQQQLRKFAEHAGLDVESVR